MIRRTLGAAVLLYLCAPALSADVKITVDAAGKKVIFNEPSAARTRRFAASLVIPPEAQLAEIIDQHSYAADLDPKLVRAVIQVESGYNSSALSNKGAIGLMQLMPQTAHELGVSDPYDPSENVHGGTAYLRQLLTQFEERIELAVAAYNAGPNAVKKYGGVPPYDETVDYVQRVIALYEGREVPVRVAGGFGRKVAVARDASGRFVMTTAGLAPRR
jgi:soluble lytic murein transglycosylase-like protein